tara:strand:+ start:1124 stop:1318 length:195 start_codon:yes stop_codon:yes gene_type:complete
MIKVTPPSKTTFYNGAKVPEDGIEVSEATAEALIAAGWKRQSAPPPPKPQKTKLPVPTEKQKED